MPEPPPPPPPMLSRPDRPPIVVRPPSFWRTFAAATLGTVVGLGLLLFLLVALLSALATAFGEPGPASVADGSVLVVDLKGDVPERAAPANPLLGESDALDLVAVHGALARAAEDARIAAVLVRTDGLSAEWATLEAVRREIAAVGAAGKPVVGFSRGAGTGEKDLFVLSTADTVLLRPLSAVEVNGFALQPTFFKRALDRFGVEANVVRAGTFKAAVEPFLREDLSPENRAQLRALLDAQTRAFVAAVAEGRGLPRDSVAAHLTTRPILTAEDAVRQKLADGLVDEGALRERLARRFADGDADELVLVKAVDYARAAPVPAASGGTVAVVYATGAIVDGQSGEGGSLFGGGASVGDRTFAEAMRAAREDEAVKAIVLRINSPGGSVSASEAMRLEVARAAAAKPLVVSMGDYAASGGYWIATPAETIVAEPTTLTGSIGVFALWFNPARLLEDRLGVTLDSVTTGPYAGLLSAAASPSDAERALLQRTVDTTYARFLQIVAASRRMPVAAVDSLAQGRVWAGEDALRRGLVDSLGGLDAAVRLAARRAGLDPDAVRTRPLPAPTSWADRMRRTFEVRVAARLAPDPLGPLGQALARTAHVVAPLDAWQGRPVAWLPPVYDAR